MTTLERSKTENHNLDMNEQQDQLAVLLTNLIAPIRDNPGVARVGMNMICVHFFSGVV
jgi:hypothetical protein